MPEAILPIVLIIFLIIFKVSRKRYEFALSARIAMAVMLVSTGIAHFVYTKGMALMLPGWVPYREEMVYISGVLEVLMAVALLIPNIQKITGWLVILFFIVILPVNINAAVKHVNMDTGDYTGSGTGYLLYRIPLQLFFIGWVYFSCIRFPAGVKSGME
ncbi:hypothetical protein [Chryseobacterium sp.]|uniref:DoxX family protein n=1 Tax=Chryseobacterium sp. TaxID=1871047 RepID=UPI00333EE191